MWTDWTNWTACTPANGQCGLGSQSKTRVCNSTSPNAYCFGSSSESQICNSSVSCGAYETQLPDLLVIVLNENNCTRDWRLLYFSPLVSGNWSAWSNWSSCSVTCGGGLQFRTRNCTNPPPNYPGGNCTGNSADTQSCNTSPCPGAPATNSNRKQYTSLCCGSRTRTRM